MTAVSVLNGLFGPGDDGYPLWLATVRVDILVFLACAAVRAGWRLWSGPVPSTRMTRCELVGVLGLTALAGLLRIAVVHNLSDLGGIGYSRILYGYKGHFGAAQLYALVYARTAREIETAILLNRVAGTLTVPLVYALCRRLVPETRAVAAIAAALVACHPLHVLFSGTDCLPIATSALAAACYLLLAQAVDGAGGPRWVDAVAMSGAAAGLTLLTQVRYENALFLIPAALYLWARRYRLRSDVGIVGGATFALFAAVYAVEALCAGTSFQNPVRVADGVRIALRAVWVNPIFAIGPALLGTSAALLVPRSRIRLLAALPLAIALPLSGITNTEVHNLARTYLNEVLLVTLVAGYGLALLWTSPWRVARVVAAAGLLWAVALPVLLWPGLRERHLETAEHDFLRTALASLPPGIDRIIVPDDERLARETHSTIELATKYRLIASAAGADGVELVGMTRFVEHPGEFDCSRDNCALFRGVPCLGLPTYWFGAPACGQLMATRAGPPLREEEIVAGSFLDCSLYRGAERARVCEPAHRAQRLGLYRLTPR